MADPVLILITGIVNPFTGSRLPLSTSWLSGLEKDSDDEEDASERVEGGGVSMLGRMALLWPLLLLFPCLNSVP